MGIESVILTQFNAGEFSPLMEGRVDIEGYFASCRQLVNMVPTTWGPAMMRPGTRFIREIQNSAAAAALIPFQRSTIQAYMLEAGAGYLIPYKDKGRIEVADTDAAISNGAFTANITGWDDRSTGGLGNQISHDATNGRLTLETSGTAADDIGWAEQDVVIGAAFQNVQHCLQFDVIAAAGDQIEFQVGTATTGAQIIGPLTRKTGRHVVSFTPGATTFYVQFRNRGNFRDKDVQIDNVRFLDNEPLQIPTDYAAADAQGLRWEQDIDVLYLEHGNYARRRLESHGDTTWSWVLFDFEDGPFLKANTTTTTFTLAAATGLGVTLTASSTIGINSNEGFKTTDIGRLFRFKNGADPWGWGIIVGRTSTTVVTVDIRATVTTATATTNWRLGLYSDTLGHATKGEFHEQRSALGGAAGQPDRTDLSATDDFPKFTPDTGDDDAIPVVLASSGANPVAWLVSSRVLLVGTRSDMADQRPAVVRASGVFRIGASSATSPLTPTTAQAKQENVSVLAVERLGTRLREIKYSFDIDGYVGLDKTIRAEHIGESGLDRQAFQKVPWATDWMVRGDGQLAGFVFEPDEKVQAWSRHILGGSFGGGAAVVEDTAVIPGTGGDELWLLVKRTINGATKRYIEVMEDRLTDLTAQEDCFFVDCGLTLDNALAITNVTSADPVVVTLTDASSLANGDAVILSDIVGCEDDTEDSDLPTLNGRSFTVADKAGNSFELTDADGNDVDGTALSAYVSGGKCNEKVATVSGLTHLNGQTVAVLGDGAVQTERVVAAGAITLEKKAGVVQVGLAYDWILQPQRLEGGARFGTAQITPKQISKLSARLWRSGPFQAGPTADNLETVSFGPPALGLATPLFSGDKQLPFDAVVNESGDIYLTGSSPLPVNIIALVMRVVTEEE